MTRQSLIAVYAAAAAGLLATTSPASATQHSGTQPGTATARPMTMHETMPEGMMLRMPTMDSARGRKLFASKGCVVCHSVNGVGGEDAPPLDATTMGRMMNPFEFAAKMWRGAEAMIVLQREELGEQIAFTGNELSDIIAFTHHPDEQQKFSEADIPSRIKGLMHHMEEEESEEHEQEHQADKPTE